MIRGFSTSAAIVATVSSLAFVAACGESSSEPSGSDQPTGSGPTETRPGYGGTGDSGPTQPESAGDERPAAPDDAISERPGGPDGPDGDDSNGQS